MSTVTLVNASPFSIRESRPQCIPGFIHVDAPNLLDGQIKVVTIQDGTAGQYIDYERGWVNHPLPGEVLVESIINDLCGAQIGTESGGKPALFFVPGSKTEAQVKEQHKTELEKARELQKKWFEALVVMGDVGWGKTKSQLAISDIHRAAARSLGVQREWVDLSPGSMIQCPACMTLVRKIATVCYACKCVLNVEKFKELQFAK